MIDGEVIWTTPEHPFYLGNGQWISAGDLQDGDLIRNANWQLGQVQDVTTIYQTRPMYNLSVDTAHTYFVGQQQWLVHNSCGDVAFGFSKNLSRFKELIPGARSYRDFGLDPYSSTFTDDLLNMMNNADNIHFDISDMRGLNGSDGVLSGPIDWNAPGSTNWELRTIWDNPELLSKTTFYRNGQVISIEDIMNLE